jgi:FMN reductase [NAD(P)H]
LSLWRLFEKRRMCRCYLDLPVPRALLLRVLEAARRSPSAGHAQGVRFAVLTNQDQRNQIATVFGEEAYLKRGFRAWLSTAPVHIVTAVSTEAYEERYAQPDKVTEPNDWPVPYAVLDAGKALMSLYLAAEEAGLACGYLGPHAGPDLVQMFDLPEDWMFVGLVTLGYRDPEVRAKTRSERLGWRDFDEVVKWLS